MKKSGAFVVFTFVVVLAGCAQDGAPIFVTGPLKSLCTTPGGLDGSVENSDTYTSPGGFFSVRVPSLGDPRHAKCSDRQTSQSNTVVFISDAFWCESHGVGSQKLPAGAKADSENLFERTLQGWRVGGSPKVMERKTVQTQYGSAYFAMTLVSGSAPCWSATIKDGVKTTSKIDGIILGYWLRRGEYGHVILYHTRKKSMFGGASSNTDEMRKKLNRFFDSFRPGPLKDG